MLLAAGLGRERGAKIRCAPAAMTGPLYVLDWVVYYCSNIFCGFFDHVVFVLHVDSPNRLLSWLLHMPRYDVACVAADQGRKLSCLCKGRVVKCARLSSSPKVHQLSPSIISITSRTHSIHLLSVIYDSALGDRSSGTPAIHSVWNHLAKLSIVSQ